MYVICRSVSTTTTLHIYVYKLMSSRGGKSFVRLGTSMHVLNASPKTFILEICIVLFPFPTSSHCCSSLFPFNLHLLPYVIMADFSRQPAYSKHDIVANTTDITADKVKVTVPVFN
jgi:hypothetical protein